MPPAGPTAADLTVVVSSDDVDGDAVRDLALQWHEDGLLGDFAWVTPAEVERGAYGPPVIRARVTGRDAPVELMSHLGMRPRGLIRVVLLHLLTHEMSDPETLVETCDEIAELVNRSRPRTLDPQGRHQGSQLLRVNLMVPESDLLPQDPRIILRAWEVNAVVSPEDRPELDRQSVFVRRSVNLHSHALAAAATVGGLWAEAATGVFDSHESDSTTGGGEIVVLRCQARVVVGDDGVERLTRTVISALEDSPVGAPAWVSWGVPADNPTALVRSCTEELMTHPEWAPLAREEEPLHKQQVPLRAAMRQWLTFQLLLVPAVFHFLFGWGRGIVERRVTALTVGRDAGEEGKLRPLPPDAVEKIAKGRMQRLEDDLSPSRLDEEAGAWAQTTPGAWRELRQLALGLVDGGRLSARFTRGGHGGAVEVVPPGSVVGAPDDDYELSSGLRVGLVDVELAAEAVAEIEKVREEEEKARARRAADAERAARYPSRSRAGARSPAQRTPAAPARATPATGTSAPTVTAAVPPAGPAAPPEVGASPAPAETPAVATSEAEPVVVGRRIAPTPESSEEPPATSGTEAPPPAPAAAAGRRIAHASEPEPGHTTAGPAVEQSDPAADPIPSAVPEPPAEPSPEPDPPSVPAAPETPEPPPEPQAPEADEHDPDDPEEFLAWLEQRRATLLWRLTARALEQSTRERERAERAHKAVADSSPPSTDKLESARGFLVTCWGLVLAALGLILLLNIASLFSDPVEFLTSLGDVFSADVLRILLITVAVLLLAGTLYFQAMKSYDWALTRRMHELTQARDDYITSRHQERRWQLMHRGLVDWATILSEVLHRPWTPPCSPQVERLPVYGGLPAAVGVAVPVPERDQPDAAFIARAIEVVCQKGWLGAEFARVLEASPANSSANSGRSRDAEDQGDLPADLDLGQRRRGPRRELAQVASRESTKQAATRALLEGMSGLLHSGDVRLPDRAVMRVGFYSQGETSFDRDFLTPRDTVAPLVNEVFSPSAQLAQVQVPERTVLFLPQGIEVPRSLRATQRLTVMPSEGTMTIRVDLSATVTHDNISLFHRVERPEYRPTAPPDDFN